MMDVFKEQILKCVGEHQPITTQRLQQMTGEPKRRISAVLGQLRHLGLVFTKAAIGHFHGECGYENWLENGGREYLSCRGRNGAMRSNESRARSGRTTPQRAVEMLRQNGPMLATALADSLGIPHKNMYSQLTTMLARKQVIRSDVKGRHIYNVAPDPVQPKKQGTAGNTIFEECRHNWQGYQIHKIFGSARA